MGSKKLQEEGIDFLRTMPDNEVNSRNIDLKNLGLPEIYKEFFIKSSSFINEITTSYDSKSVDIKEKLKYLKIYFKQDENNIFSIGFSISSEIDDLFGINDSFFIINTNNELEEITDQSVFKKHTLNFANKLLPIINAKTKFNDTEMHNTQVIYYNLKDVFFFMVKHFTQPTQYSKLFFQMIKFEKTVTEKNNQNKLSLVVRAESESKSTSESYDFGTVYP
ncbi:hypothetical protein [Flavobacterium poyangense]|uniref:hypothetical protein n=1 Tax=Flavobacterium poyangense TaxID=2204302 RepID=UPI00141FEFBE|nr:hypothetical protein [Flavobacterium sp. JXAS1]